MIEITFISPKGPLYRHKGGVFGRSLRAAPLTFSTLASLIPPEIETNITIIDEGIETIPANIKADIIAMTVITGASIRAYELADYFRNLGKFVVLGGPHVTLQPKEAVLHADSIFVGYAEKTWPTFLYDYLKGHTKTEYVMEPDFDFSRPEYRPIPKRHLLKRKGYSTLNTIEATRGCVHGCEFCVVPSAWGNRPFLKPVSHVVSEIKQMKAKSIIFYDLNLIANVIYAKELFEALVPLNIRWFGLATTSIQENMIDLMAKSGCKGLLIGFESLNAGSLQMTRKAFNRPAHYASLIENLQKAKILINGTFILGFDEDDHSSFLRVKDFVLNTGIDLPRFAILTPFPGTPLFNKLDNSGRIFTRDWSLYDGQHVVYKPKNLSPEELMLYHEQLWKDVYTYRGILKRVGLRVVKRISYAPIILGTNWAYRYYAHNLKRFYTCHGGVG